MNHQLAINAAILILIAFALYLTNNPCVLAFLLLLPQMPFALSSQKMAMQSGIMGEEMGQEDENYDSSGRCGFSRSGD